MKRTFYLWLLPLLWTTCSLFSFQFPGDEYAMYAISSMAGAWVLFFIKNAGDIHDLIFRGSIALTGAVTMTLFGVLMDRLRIRKVVWGFIFLAASVAIFILSIKAYPTIDKALRKNGSWWAYIFFAINMGLYCSVFLSFIAKGIESAWRRNRRINQPLPGGDA